MELVIATKNVHKAREFRAMLQNIPQLDIVTLHAFPQYIPPEETGYTFQENAQSKAEHAARILSKWVLADDSGLVVPALKGEPGIRSRRYASDSATDAENRKKLLKAMQNLAGIERSAYFECALCLANPQGVQKVVTGTCEGEISEEEHGNNGFGYDAVFSKYDYGGKTFAELPEEVKNRVSHRGKAIEKMSLHLHALSH